MPLDLPPLRAPVIADLVLSLDDTHSAGLVWLRDTYGWDLTASDASDPAWRVTRLYALREVLARQRVADSVSQVSLAHATGAMLDHIGLTYYQLTRNTAETDTAFRARIAAAPSLHAVGLTAAWYESMAGMVDGVSSVFAVGAARPDEDAGTTPGAVTLAVGSDGVPTDALLDAIVARVTAADVRQQTDRVSVVPAYRIPYDVAVTLTLQADVDAVEALATAEANLAALSLVTDRIGGETSEVLVAGAVVNPGVVRVATVALEEVLGARASLTHGAGTSEIEFSAVATGDDGTAVIIALVDPGANEQALEIARVADAVTVTLATDDSGAIITTAAQLVGAWRTSPARRRALARLATGAGDGDGTVAALAAAPLVAGADATMARTTLTAPATARLAVRTATVALA